MEGAYQTLWHTTPIRVERGDLGLADVISTTSITVAAASVVAGIVLTVLQLRDLVKARQSDLLMRLYSMWGGEEYQKAAWVVIELQFEDYEDFARKYGPFTSQNPISIPFFKVAWFFNGIGVLLKRGLADPRMVDDLFGYMVIWSWELMRPLVEGERKQFAQPRSLEWFEFLHAEMKRRHQEQASAG